MACSRLTDGNASRKLFKAVAALQIVNQISEGDTRSDEHGDAAKNPRVAVDDACDGGHPNLLPSIYSREPLLVCLDL